MRDLPSLLLLPTTLLLLGQALPQLGHRPPLRLRPVRGTQATAHPDRASESVPQARATKIGNRDHYSSLQMLLRLPLDLDLTA